MGDRNLGFVGLGLVVLVAALLWLGLRGDSAPPVADDETAESSVRGVKARRVRPPPRRLGLLDAPRATARPDDAVAGRLDGTVTSWLDSAPVAGAELTFMGGGTLETAVTDADGHFSFVAPRPGSYALASVLADGYLPYAPELGQVRLRFQARAGQRVDGANIQLMPRTEVVGQVQDEGGRVVADASVRWLGVGTGDAALADDEPEYRSDTRGEFRFEARRGRWLEGTHPEHGVGRVRIDARTVAVGRVALTLHPDGEPAEGTIGGRVLDPQGAPVAGAKVLASRDDEPGAEAVTDDTGTFELVDLTPGPHRVEARHPPYAPVWASRVPTGSDAVQLVLSPGGSIAGTITTDAGDAVPGSTVVALRHTGPMTRASQAQATVFDADGEYRLDGLPPGVYDVVGGAADHALARVRAVEVGGGEVEVALVLPQGGRIHGRVIDEAGAALPQARVEVERSLAAGASITPLRSSALSDDEGFFEIAGVEPGRHSVHAYAQGHAPRSLSGVEVEAGGEAGPLKIVLTAAEDAIGEVFDIVGIGVMLRVEGEVLQVIEVLPDAGAHRAGVMPQDRIVAIDGVPVKAWGDFGEAVQALRGREGTEVVLRIERGEDGEVVPLIVVRSRVRG